jgi:hypothetical protein
VERDSHFDVRAQGYSLSIQPNGQAVLKGLGLEGVARTQARGLVNTAFTTVHLQTGQVRYMVLLGTVCLSVRRLFVIRVLKYADLPVDWPVGPRGYCNTRVADLVAHNTHPHPH